MPKGTATFLKCYKCVCCYFKYYLPKHIRRIRRHNTCLWIKRSLNDYRNYVRSEKTINPLNAELNPICYLLALLAHHFLHVSRIRVKSLTLRLLMSYIYMEHLFLMFLDHTQRRSTVGRTPLDE